MEGIVFIHRPSTSNESKLNYAVTMSLLVPRCFPTLNSTRHKDLAITSDAYKRCSSECK
jgi:hypothetical protein